MTTGLQLKSQLGLVSFKYDNFIESRKLRIIKKDIYTEKHHIIPKSIDEDNSLKNMILLTAREHFIAHLILWKETTGLNHKKMAFAFWGLTQRGHINLNSRQFSILRQEVSRNMSEQQANFIRINKDNVNKWVNNGINEKLTGNQNLIKRLISKDWKYGRLESKNKGLIPINKDGQQKIIKPELLSLYIEKGCVEGNPTFKKWIKETTIITNGKETIRVLKKEVNIYIQKDLVSDFIKNGWKKGNFSKIGKPGANVGRKKINNGKIHKFISIEELKTWLNNGCVLGKIAV